MLATGTRPSIPAELEFVKEHVITSDDLFWCPYEPKDTLVIGGGYVALESASFLAQIGYNVTCIVRQIALRSFDRECADLIVKSLEEAGVKVYLNTSISEVELLKEADLKSNKPGLFRVKCKKNDQQGVRFEVFSRVF